MESEMRPLNTDVDASAGQLGPAMVGGLRGSGKATATGDGAQVPEPAP